MALSQELKTALDETKLTYEELRAFEVGLTLLSPEEQGEFATIVRDNPELVYPLYINFKAKLHAALSDEKEWETAIEREIVELEGFLKKRKVGDEIM
jgi:hypothetical protein